MPDRHGTAYWPGVSGVISCSYTCSQGTTPGIATLEIPEGDVARVRPYGDLTITDGVGGVTLRGCRVQAINFTNDGGPRRVLLHVADRRWMWRFGSVTGSWNVVEPDPDPDLFPPGEFVLAGGPYAPGTYRPCHLLMADCLAAMGEGPGSLVSPAPAVPVPAVWDHENPAAALSQLADAVGFRVCLQVGPNRVLVAPAGTGRTLPENLPIISESPSIALPGRPGGIELVGGAWVWNDYLRLEPVGLEPGGTVRPIDQLSYRPAAGWGGTNPATFADATATAELTQSEAVEQAKKCVWRMWRVAMVDVTTALPPGPNVPGYGLVRDRKQIELLPAQFGATRGVNGQPETSPPYLIGSIFIPKAAGLDLTALAGFFDNSDPRSGQRLPVGVQIDTARGLVTTDRQLYISLGGKTGPLQLVPPILLLRTAFRIREVVGRRPVQFRRGGANTGAVPGCPAEILRHPELVPVTTVLRGNAHKEVRDVTDNVADLVPAADYYLQRAAEKYEVTGAVSRTYAGIHAIDCDGAIAQVTWSVGGGAPATTTASLNTEHDRYAPPFPERRRRERQVSFFAREAAQQRGVGAGGDFGGGPGGGGGYRSQNPPPEPPQGQ